MTNTPDSSSKYDSEKSNFQNRLTKKINHSLARKHISNRQLADLIGKSPMTVGRMLKGESDISAFDLKKISEVLDISIDSFYEEIPDDVANYANAYKTYLLKMTVTERRKINAAVKAYYEADKEL